MQRTRRRLHLGRDVPAAAAVWLAAIAVVGAFAWIVGDILRGGWGAIGLEFLTTAPRNAGRAGGIAPMLVSTLAVVAVALTAALPLGLATAVPDDLRRAAAALGLSRVAAVRRVLLPAALPALTAAVVLSLGRALAETAALLFTSGYVDRMPTSLLDSGRTLSVHIYDLAMNVPGGDQAAYGSALVLLLALLGVNAAAHGLTRVWQQRLGGR